MDEPRIDLDAYLRRVGLSAAPLPPTAATLRALHVAHAGAIPFENLDVRLGRGVRLDLASLQEKLVGRRRGGYCFEQNTLFATALRAIGFSVTPLEARVRPPGATSLLPRTHMALAVAADGRDWLADVGFGGDGLLEPVPLDGEIAEGPAGALAVGVEEGGTRVLRRRDDEGWRDLYAFGMVPALAIDFEVANHFTATHPGSPFRGTLTAQKLTPEARHVLRGRTYVARTPAGEERREIGDEEASAVLAEVFGLHVPLADVRRALADGPIAMSI